MVQVERKVFIEWLDGLRGMAVGGAIFLSSGVGIVVLLICSYLSYQYFERKFLRMKQYFA